MNAQEKANAARMLIEHPLITELFEELEKSAVDVAMYAAPTDHETRAAKLTEARAIRALRQQLSTLVSEGEAKQTFKGSVA